MRLSHQLLLAMSLTTVVAIGATSYTGLKAASGSLEEAYNEKLAYIISCAFDFDICVWNTYLAYP